ncbi:MAG TPA: nucleoside deaminase [Micropepsaceae bacterium]|nr:nucleoside deaminase [Micropepsaceae bacterium]
MKNSHEQFMAEAIRLSRQSVTSGGGPFGAVVVKDGKIIATGTNRVTISNDPTAHGEIVAIRSACGILKSFQLDDCVLYSSTEPCPMCLGAIYWARPRAVYFANTREDAANAGFDDAFIYGELGTAYPERKIPFRQMMREPAVEVLKEWSSKADKTPY